MNETDREYHQAPITNEGKAKSARASAVANNDGVAAASPHRVLFSALPHQDEEEKRRMANQTAAVNRSKLSTKQQTINIA